MFRAAFLFVGAPYEGKGQEGKENIGDPRPQPRRDDLIPAEGLSRLEAAVIGEADEYAEAKAVGHTRATGVRTEGGA